MEFNYIQIDIAKRKFKFNKNQSSIYKINKKGQVWLQEKGESNYKREKKYRQDGFTEFEACEWPGIGSPWFRQYAKSVCESIREFLGKYDRYTNERNLQSIDICEVLYLMHLNHSFEQPVFLQVINTVFQWTFGAVHVELTGTFNNWINPIPLNKMENNCFEVILKLSPGVYQYKYIVDGEWRFSPDDPTCNDENGNINNIIDTTNIERSVSLIGQGNSARFLAMGSQSHSVNFNQQSGRVATSVPNTLPLQNGPVLNRVNIPNPNLNINPIHNINPNHFNPFQGQQQQIYVSAQNQQQQQQLQPFQLLQQKQQQQYLQQGVNLIQQQNVQLIQQGNASLIPQQNGLMPNPQNTPSAFNVEQQSNIQILQQLQSNPLLMKNSSFMKQYERAIKQLQGTQIQHVQPNIQIMQPSSGDITFTNITNLSPNQSLNKRSSSNCAFDKQYLQVQAQIIQQNKTNFETAFKEEAPQIPPHLLSVLSLKKRDAQKVSIWREKQLHPNTPFKSVFKTTEDQEEMDAEHNNDIQNALEPDLTLQNTQNDDAEVLIHIFQPGHSLAPVDHVTLYLSFVSDFIETLFLYQISNHVGIDNFKHKDGYNVYCTTQRFKTKYTTYRFYSHKSDTQFIF